jgi:hypothetical protein
MMEDPDSEMTELGESGRSDAIDMMVERESGVMGNRKDWLIYE